MKFEKIFSSFFKAFSKKRKLFDGPCIIRFVIPSSEPDIHPSDSFCVFRRSLVGSVLSY